MIKQRIMLKEISEVEYIVTWGHRTRVVFTVKVSIYETKIISRKLKYIFLKKATPHFLGHIGLQKKKEEWKQFLGDLPLFVWCILTLALKTNSLLWMVIKNDIWKLNPKIDGLVCCKTVVGSNYNLNLSLG